MRKLRQALTLCGTYVEDEPNQLEGANLFDVTCKGCTAKGKALPPRQTTGLSMITVGTGKTVHAARIIDANSAGHRINELIPMIEEVVLNPIALAAVTGSLISEQERLLEMVKAARADGHG